MTGDGATTPDARDLRFFPADPDQATLFSAEQIRRFNERGVISGVRIFDEAEVKRNRAVCDGILEAYRASGRDSYSAVSCHSTCRSVYDITKHPPILDRVKELIGPDVIVWGTQYFCKMPGETKVISWHQDAPYWPITPSHSVTVWVAIDDADDENASMRVIPGSHLHGPIEARESKAEDNNVLQLVIDDAERFGAPETLKYRAGEVSFHADLLLHGSNANLSNRRRAALTIRYTNARCRGLTPFVRSMIVHCSGENPDGHWQPCHRPEGDDPFSDPRPAEAKEVTERSAEGWMQHIDDLVKRHPVNAREIGIKVRYEITGTGDFLVDLRDQIGVRRDRDTPAECTIKMATDDFTDVMAGKVDPARLLFEQRLVIDGDIRDAIRLAEVLNWS